MNAGDIMTRDPVRVQAGTPLSVAAQLMIDHRVSGLPVVDANGQVIGMLTEGDLLRRAEIGTDAGASWLKVFFTPGRVAEDFVHTHARRVGEIMTRDGVSVTEATPLREVVTLMQTKRIKRVPVLRGGTLVGIVSRADLVRALAEILQRPSSPAGDDEAIRENIYAELGRQAWAPKGIAVTVSEGHVELGGTIFDERHRQALRVVAENVPGVKSVQDNLVWIEPSSGISFGPNDAGGRSAMA